MWQWNLHGSQSVIKELLLKLECVGDGKGDPDTSVSTAALPSLLGRKHRGAKMPQGDGQSFLSELKEHVQVPWKQH